jgi:N-glycosylase/DNA lyase
MKITLNPVATPFNLDYTLQCGQVFRWQKHDEWWYGTITNRMIRIRQMGNVLEFEGSDTGFIEEYFRLSDSLPLITTGIGKDDFVKNAIRAFPGLRLIRQDPWECLISYICATFSNIPRIQKMISNLAQRFGDRQNFEDCSFYAFPSPKSLADADLKALTACKLGFRAKSVLETAKKIHTETVRLAELEKLDYQTAKNELLRLAGVGEKVADCVLLFSLNKLEAFPVDVWIKKTILEHYGNFFDDSFVQKAQHKQSMTPKEYERISSFARGYFGDYAGYAQQYLYHFERLTCKAVWPSILRSCS